MFTKTDLTNWSIIFRPHPARFYKPILRNIVQRCVQLNCTHTKEMFYRYHNQIAFQDNWWHDIRFTFLFVFAWFMVTTCKLNLIKNLIQVSNKWLALIHGACNSIWGHQEWEMVHSNRRLSIKEVWNVWPWSLFWDTSICNLEKYSHNWFYVQ